MLGQRSLRGLDSTGEAGEERTVNGAKNSFFVICIWVRFSLARSGLDFGKREVVVSACFPKNAVQTN